MLVWGTIGFLTIPNLLLLPSCGLDPSWQVGLNMAKIYGFRFGKDIVITFGPLGFMYLPLFCEFNTWLISASFCLFVHFLLIYLIVTTMKKLSARLMDYVLMGIALMFVLPATCIEYKLLFSILILLYLSIVDQSNPNHLLTLCVFAPFLMAVVSLIKFTAMLVSVSIFLFIVVFHLYKKQISRLCCILFAYIVSVLVLLVMVKQKVTDFPTYLLNSYEVSDGYNSAMSLDGPFRHVCVGVCVVGLLIFLLLDSILKNKPGLKYFILLNLGFVFVSFKHGFIRHNGHVYIFFANALLVFCFMYVSHKKQLTLPLRCLSLILICVLIAFIFEGYRYQEVLLIPDALGKLKMVSSAVSLVTDDAASRAQRLENAKSRMRECYSLNDETIKYIGNRSIDVMPCEISLPFAYSLKWSPSPVFQSYSAYTDKLDMLNSQYFESVDAPEFLLYDFSSIDKRYPLFDTPATFRTILRNYKPVFIDGKFIILRKTDRRSLSSSKPISVLDMEFGKYVSVPKTKNGYLFAKIYIEYNFLGKIAKLVYKPPNVYIILFADGYSFMHRFIFSTARNGIFLSQYVYDVEDLFAVWNGRLNNNLDMVAIITPNKHFYDKRIRVEFFEVP